MEVKASEIDVVLGGRKILNCLSQVWDSRSHSVILGPNGAGKTTLVNALSGHVRVSNGSISIDGQNVTRMSPHRRSSRFLRRSFQMPPNPGELTGRELLNLATANWQHQEEYQSGPSRELLKAPLIASSLDIPISETDHSTRKLLEVLSVICSPASVLLLDEPMAGLAAPEKAFLLDILLKETGRTVLIVEHDLEAIRRLDCETLFMMDGRIVHRGDFSSTQEFAEKLNVYF